MAALTILFSEGSVESNESTSFPTRPVEPVTSTTFFPFVLLLFVKVVLVFSFDFSDDDMVVVVVLDDDDDALLNALR